MWCSADAVVYLYVYLGTCLCLRTENRFWISRLWGGVRWGGGMLTFLVLRTWYIAMLLRSLRSFAALHVATLLMGWGGVGWGGGACQRSLYFVHDILPCCWDLWDRLLRYMCWWGGMGWGGVGGHVNVPCASYMIYCHAAEISGVVYYVTTLHVATLLRSLGSFTTLHVATLLRSLGLFTTLHAATLLRSLVSFTTLHVLCGIWWKSQFPATWVPKVTSWWCMLELGNGDAFTRMLTASWKRCMRCSDDAEKPKNAPQVFPGFPIIKSARHCGKITTF